MCTCQENNSPKQERNDLKKMLYIYMGVDGVCLNMLVQAARSTCGSEDCGQKEMAPDLEVAHSASLHA